MYLLVQMCPSSYMLKLILLFKITFILFLQPQADSWDKIYLPYNNLFCRFNILSLCLSALCLRNTSIIM